MGISSHLPSPQFSLEGELTSWAKDTIHQYEKRAGELTTEVRHLDEQAHTLQQLLDAVKSAMATKGVVNLNDPAIAPLIHTLKEGGLDIPVPPDGMLTKQTAADWLKIVDDDRHQIANRIQRLQSEIPLALGHLKETLAIILKILQQIHEIIMMILHNMASHAK